MKKLISQKVLLLLFLIILIFQMGCKKSNLSPNNTIAKVLYIIDSKIMVVNADGSGAHDINLTLPDHVILDSHDPRISPDGSIIFFDAYKTDNDNVTISHDIYSCSINGGTTNLVVSSGSTNIENNINATYLAQQQTKIVYGQALQNEYYTFKVYTANADGTNAQQINFALPSNTYLNSPYAKPSTDNTTLYFSAQPFFNFQYSSPTIYSSNLDGSNIKVITSSNSISVGFTVGDFSVNQQSKILYAELSDGSSIFGGYHPSWSFYTVNIDGSGKQQINLALPNDVQTSSVSVPVISKDRKTIYFQTIALDSSGNMIASIYSSNMDGSNPKLIVTYDNSKNLIMGDIF